MNSTESKLARAIAETPMESETRAELVEALVSRLNDRGSFSPTAFRIACAGPGVPPQPAPDPPRADPPPARQPATARPVVARLTPELRKLCFGRLRLDVDREDLVTTLAVAVWSYLRAEIPEKDLYHALVRLADHDPDLRTLLLEIEEQDD